MKLSLKSAVAAAVLTSAAPAMAVNIGGISVPTGPHFEVASVYENVVTAVGDVLTGYGQVTQINGSANFCVAGPLLCELTYTFGGFTVTNFAATDIVFSGGWVNFYVGTGATLNFNPFTSASQAEDIAEASDGSLWMTLMGHNNIADGGVHGAAVAGVLFASGNSFGTGTDVGTGLGLLDIDLTGAANGNAAGAGAVANVAFDTDSIADNIMGTADLQLGSSFGTAVPPFHGQTPLAGSADMRGLVQVPEPTAISLLGLGLLGATFARRRKNAA